MSKKAPMKRWIALALVLAMLAGFPMPARAEEAAPATSESLDFVKTDDVPNAKGLTGCGYAYIRRK